jgi:ParB-like chromosome segregation protein Spo0J
MGEPLPVEQQLTNAPPVPPAPPTQYNPPPNPPNQFFTVEDIEKARREERDKLYGRISRTDERFKTLEEELVSLKADRDRRVEDEAQHRAQAEALLKAKSEEELSAKQLIEQREKEWNDRFQKMTEQQEIDKALQAKEREFIALQSYIQRRAAEEQIGETIGGELLEFINGNNEQEVEASITKLREKTQSILNGIRDGQQQARASLPGVSMTGAPPSGGPLDNISGQQRQLSPEDIAKIPMSEWHKFRSQIGIDGAGSNRGLYG